MAGARRKNRHKPWHDLFATEIRRLDQLVKQIRQIIRMWSAFKFIKGINKSLVPKLANQNFDIENYVLVFFFMGENKTGRAPAF